MRLLKSLSLVAILALVFALPVQAAVISEIRIDQPGSDIDEYFELTGTPGESLDGLTYVVIGDGATASGTIEMALDLTGSSIPADGVFLAAESTFSLGGSVDLTASLSFENGDNVSHYLVRGFTGALGDDLDVDDDCVLDSTPWAGIEDQIALLEEANPPTGTECHYGANTIGPDGTFVPGHVYRCPNNVWVIGEFDPALLDDTPGVGNTNCPVGTRQESFGTVKSRF